MATKMKKAGASSAADRMRRFSTATGAKVEETEDGGVKVANAPRRLRPAARSPRPCDTRRGAPTLAPVCARCMRAHTITSAACTQAHNPFLEMLEEEEEEEELELYVEELIVELAKGAGGFGMDITESGHVVGNTPGGVAEAAGAAAARCCGRASADSIGRLTLFCVAALSRFAEVPTEHCKIKVVNGIAVNGKAEIVAALGKPATGENGGVVFEFALGVTKYRKAELLREEGEKLFEEKQYEAAMSVLIDAGNLCVYRACRRPSPAADRLSAPRTRGPAWFFGS
jgi:hypothetical protein